ncbi:MAG: YadA-like family protein, partial [Leptolyngbyaceae bacterium]|nr:YadA-like family protein [Leptolyngbyaceae bacterium]
SAAFGINAQATGAGSTAIGNGAIATGANQMTFGTSTSYYTLPGLASNGTFIGRTNQVAGETRFVTVDTQGNLGTANFDPDAITRGLVTLGEQIESVGALSAAMSAIPNLVAAGERGGCGIGTGVYGGAFAGAFGCVTRVNGSVSINAAGAFTSTPSSQYSSGSSFMGRVGVFFQF